MLIQSFNGNGLLTFTFDTSIQKLRFLCSETQSGASQPKTRRLVELSNQRQVYSVRLNVGYYEVIGGARGVMVIVTGYVMVIVTVNGMSITEKKPNFNT